MAGSCLMIHLFLTVGRGAWLLPNDMEMCGFLAEKLFVEFPASIHRILDSVSACHSMTIDK